MICVGLESHAGMQPGSVRALPFTLCQHPYIALVPCPAPPRPLAAPHAGGAAGAGPALAALPGWRAAAMLPAHVADAEEITNIIFSSGTTGQPLDVLGTRFLCRHCRLLCRYHGVCTAQPAHPITPSNAMPACLPACLQASPRPSPGPTSRPCARVPTLSSTRMCGRATCCAGPPTWAG